MSARFARHLADAGADPGPRSFPAPNAPKDVLWLFRPMKLEKHLTGLEECNAIRCLLIKGHIEFGPVEKSPSPAVSRIPLQNKWFLDISLSWLGFA